MSSRSAYTFGTFCERCTPFSLCLCLLLNCRGVGGTAVSILPAQQHCSLILAFIPDLPALRSNARALKISGASLLPMGMLAIAILLSGYAVRRWACHQRSSSFYQAVRPHLDGGEAAPASELQGRSRLATLIKTELGSMNSLGLVSRSPQPSGALHHLGSSLRSVGAGTLGEMDAEMRSGTVGGTALSLSYPWGLESRSLELLPGELQVSAGGVMMGFCAATCVKLSLGTCIFPLAAGVAG